MDKAAVFIDAGYLDKVLEHDFSRARIDYKNLAREITENYELFRVYYYHCMPYRQSRPTHDEEKRYAFKQRFIEALKKIPRWEIRQGELKRRGEGFEQKGIDVMLSVDLVRLSATGQINCAIIVAGDSDFSYAVQTAKDAGVIVKMFYSQRSYSRDLWYKCDERHRITSEIIEKIIRNY